MPAYVFNAVVFKILLATALGAHAAPRWAPLQLLDRADTRVLDGHIADYIVMLREASDGTWWVGAMTDWTPRELSGPSASCQRDRAQRNWEDGPNAARYAPDWRRTERTVTSGDTLPVKLAPGGGWVAHVSPR